MHPANGSSGNLLLDIAAESVGPLVGGCAGVLIGGPLGGVAGVVVGTVVEKGINYFGRPIVAAWWRKLSGLPPAQQQAAVEQLASLSQADALNLATRLVDRAAPDASPQDKKAAATYLAAIPAAARRTLAVDRVTGRFTCPGNLLAGEQSLPQLLPADLPPFLPPCPLPGTAFQLEELVGSGGFGVVYRAKNTSLQAMDFAVKFCLDPRMRQSLIDERENLQRLRDRSQAEGWSDHVVRLCGFDLDGPVPYLVYEFAPGGDLTGYLAAGRQKTGKGLPPDEALKVVKQIAQGLAFAHEHGLVHRDLKPANVLVHGGRLELADFGIGGVVAAEALGARVGTTSANVLTAREQADLYRGSGTLLYMSREQRRGDAPDPRFDVYSLGVIWYQLLTGDVTQGLHPAWAEELTEEHQVPGQHVEWIRACVGLFNKRPPDGQALVRLLNPSEPSGARSPGGKAEGTKPLPPSAEVAQPAGQKLPLFVLLPAALMIAVGVLGLLGNLMMVIVHLGMIASMGGTPPQHMIQQLAPFSVVCLLGVAAGFVAAIAGLRMSRGRSYGLALWGCLAAALTTHVFVAGAVVGLWSLIALIVAGPERFSTAAGERRAPDGRNGGG